MNIDYLTKLSRELLGKRCRELIAAYGSLVDIRLGAPRIVQVGPNRKSFDLGEYSISIWGAQWRLCSGSRVLATSLDNLSDETEAHRNLQSLVGLKICDVQFLNEYYDLVVTFEDSMDLAIFCNDCEEDADEYSVSIRGTSYSIKCTNRVLTVKKEVKQVKQMK